MIQPSALANRRWTRVWPYLGLLLWVGLLLVFDNGQASLMAHDEGYYAQQARWILETDWVTPQWWGQPLYDRTIGIQWLIAGAYQVFGVSEASARFPSQMACGLSVLLTYAIGSQLLNRRIAWIGAAILSVTPLWVQYGRLATQDMTLVCLELIGIWALLRAEAGGWGRYGWGMLAGSILGLGFLVKGFMILLPAVALLPYLLLPRRSHPPLQNPGLYLGLGVGALPLMAWFWASWAKYGSQPFQQLLGKLLLLGRQSWHGAGPFYYFWNIPANAFPWPLFTLIGVGLLLQDPGLKRLLAEPLARRSLWYGESGHQLSLPLLLGYPLLLFLALSGFKTRTPYYALQLFPFMALLAGLALNWLLRIYNQPRSPQQWLPGLLSYGFGGLAGLLLSAGIAVLVGVPLPGLPVELPIQEIQRYGVMALGLGLGWSGLLLLWRWRLQRGKVPQGEYWLACWLVGPWLALMAAGLTGAYGDYSPELKAFVHQPQVAAILQTYPLDFVVQPRLSGEEHKTWVLLSFYTPKLGQQHSQVSQLAPGSYAWVSPELGVPPASRYQLLGKIQQWQLINVEPQQS